MGAGEGHQQLQGRAALAGLEPRQSAHRDARRARQLGQRRAALLPQRAQPRADTAQRLAQVVHGHTLPRRQQELSARHPAGAPLPEQRPTGGRAAGEVVVQQDTRDSERFWEGFYREREQVWSGEPNPVLVRETDGLTPGRALDLGCGEGADALWLAGCGWQVTAVDVSRTRSSAPRPPPAPPAWPGGSTGSSTTSGRRSRRAPSTSSAPASCTRPPSSPGRGTRAAPGGGGGRHPRRHPAGRGHGSGPSWQPVHDVRFPAPEDVLQALDPAPGAWDVERCETFRVELPGPAGQPGSGSTTCSGSAAGSSPSCRSA